MALASLHDAAVDLLGFLVARLTDVGVDVPARRVVSHGRATQEVTDGGCDEHLAVWWTAIESSAAPTAPTSGPQPGRRPTGPPVVPFGIELARCEPVGAMVGDDRVVPSAAAITDAARVGAEDAWALWHVLTAPRVDPFPTMGHRCSLHRLDAVVAVPPAGGIQSVGTTLWAEMGVAL